jgi:hypothetical protein
LFDDDSSSAYSAGLVAWEAAHAVVTLAAD